MGIRKKIVASFARHQLLGVFLIPSVALLIGSLASLPGKRIAARPSRDAAQRVLFTETKSRLEGFFSTHGRYPTDLGALELTVPDDARRSLLRDIEYAAAGKIYELRLITASGDILYSTKRATWGDRGHEALRRVTPNEIVEKLDNPVSIREITADGLITNAGDLIKIIYVDQIPTDSALLTDAIANGVEVDFAGHTFGLLRVLHWCGNDPIRRHVARVNLSALLLKSGVTVSSDLPRHMREHIEPRLGGFYGMQRRPLEYTKAGLMVSDLYSISYLGDMLHQEADYGIVPLAGLVRDRRPRGNHLAIPGVRSVSHALAGTWVFVLNPALWLLVLHPGIVFYIALRRRHRHPIIVACLSSVLLSWLLSVGTVLCEDMILERVGLQGPGIPSIEQYILGGTHSFVGTFGWTYSLVLMLLWFTVLFFPWLVKTGRIKIKNPLALPSNVVTHLTPAATRV